ncbi:MULTISPECIES: hypothetical protein [unclassified Streptomyces]|uniref:hypothetical protein n=1 Tax=unclassified Streptomyces TaxID=2593676 RepID=UPI00278BD050|nr:MULTISPECIES: hypothetical protein [unclassified Streptomyces]
MRTSSKVAVGVGAALMLAGLTAPTATAEGLAPAATAAGSQSQPHAGGGVEPMKGIAWSGLPSCARHGSLSTSGVTDHLKVSNNCSYSVKYHVKLDYASDYWETLKPGWYFTDSWKYPSALDEISNR